MIKFFNKPKKEPESVKEVLSILRKLEGDFRKVSQELADLKKEGRKSLQKTGIIRFNPFREAGGDQSFSIALLDADNSGFVITSLYGHDANRVYAKPITGGASSYPLSREEKEALDRAMKI